MDKEYTVKFPGTYSNLVVMKFKWDQEMLLCVLI